MRGQMELATGKVEKQWVNICLKEMYSIKTEIYRYRAKDKLNIDPSYQVYSLTQNLLSYFAEEVSILKELREYYDKVGIIEDEYMPSFPPSSPLTGSYFTYWAFCDLQFGKEKETIGTLFSDIGAEFNFDEIVMKALTNLNASSMRFYRHVGFDDDLIILKDLLTDKKFSCICTSSYQGVKDEIWYIRIVPNLDKVYDYHITLTTPYVIIKYSEKDWLNFFERQEIRKGSLGFEEKYYHFMKYNADFKYWHDYIMDAYVNYKSNCIYLTGIPDIKGSKPHELEEF